MDENKLNEYHDPNEQNNFSPINFHNFQTEKISHSNLNKKQKNMNFIVVMLFITMVLLILLMLSSFLILFFKFSKETGKNLKQDNIFKAAVYS